MRKLFILLLLAVAFSASAKLTQFIVRGYVEKQDYTKSTWERESLDSVFVALVRNDTVPVDFKMLAGDDDLKMTTGYEMRLLAKGGVGSYSLILNREGYEPLRHDFKVVSEGQDIVYLRSLLMEPRRENTLNEVEVVGTAIKMVMKGDTVVYDSRAFKLAEGSTLDALVRQLPGAQLADDGSITVNGKKVSSLLLNGNDFFKGDPDVALKNLPAYTVDKIKVYDKAEKDDNVTLASQKLTDTPDAENIVMDVQLKKEFAMATIFNLEGGYGPGIYNANNPKRFDSRYIGRAFAIGFGKNYRFSVFGNYNNINNNTKADSNQKDWGYSWSPNGGEQKVAIGGFDVFYNPTKKVEMSAQLTYKRDDTDREEIRSETRFFETGNLYQRSRQWSTSRSDEVSADANVRYMGDRVSVYFSPGVRWHSGRSRGYTMSANFNREPDETRRGAVIDSLFTGPTPNMRRSLTTSDYSANNSDPSDENLHFYGRVNASWRPGRGRGLFRLSASGNDSQSKERYGQYIYQQTVLDPVEKPPVRREQWANYNNRSTDFGANICYEWDKKIIGERRIRTFEVEPAIGYDLARSFRNNEMMGMALLEDLDLSSRPLPSVTAPENIRPLIGYDGNNTIRSLDLSNEMLGQLGLGYSNEKAAPSDSALNPCFGVSLNYEHRQYWRHFTYSKPWLEPEPFTYGINRCDPTDMANARLWFRSNNKLHYISFSLSYSIRTSLQSLSQLVPTMGNTNPLQIYYGPENGQDFPTPLRHSLRAYGYWFDNKRGRNASFSFGYDRSQNDLAQSSVYNPATGVTVHCPISVDGNWNFYGNLYYDMDFGPQKCWNFWVNVNYNHTNSVDYVASVGSPQRSLVRSDNPGGNIGISYKLKNGTEFMVGANTTWQHSTSPRTDFTEISALKTSMTAGIDFYLPYDIEGGTTLRAEMRRGYEDPVLNTTEWIWNAHIRKSILKGALTFKLEAVDMLGQLSNISYYVNAQARIESWTNSLPRYAMLTVSYRFNFTPNALKN